MRDLDGSGFYNSGPEQVAWGSPGDLPIPADWNGDGIDDIGVYSNGLWYIDVNGNRSFDGASESFGWGVAGWTPVPGVYQ